MNNIYEKPAVIKFTDFIEKDIQLKELGYSNWNNITMKKNNLMQSIYSFFVVIGGSGIYEYKNKSFKIKAGQIFYVPPGLECTYHYENEATKWEHITFEFTGECAKKYIEMMGLTPDNPIKNCENYDDVLLQLKSIFDRHKEENIVEYYDVLSVFYKIVSYNVKRTNPKPQNLPNIIKEYINHNYKNSDMTVESVCEMYNVNPSYMSILFKQDVGLSMKSYITKLRMAEARLLLRDSKITAKEIAFSVGFSDEVHFRKTFKKHHGITPKQYRDEMTSQVTIHDDPKE